MSITFEDRNIEGRTFNVAIYTGSVYRVDKELERTVYIVPKPGPSPAPFKYFTATFEEAKEGYAKMGEWLQEYTTLRPLVLLNMYNMVTRNNLREMMSEEEKAHINYSFPLKGNVVSRKSEAGKTHHNYGVSNVICRLLAAHGIDGYYIQRADFHSEIMICGASLLDTVLKYRKQEFVGSKLGKRGRKTYEANINPANLLTQPFAKRNAHFPGAAAAANNLNENENGYTTPSNLFPEYSYGTPKKHTRRRSRRRSRRLRRF